ncbi:MAG: pilus assembly protein PilM [Candidatus Susulua stagnicola]|nr:pilus assembly protein PilM [Candidatus Susulua stagnicola]
MKTKSGTNKHKQKQLVTALEISDKWLRVVQAECHKHKKVISAIVTKKIDSLTDDRISGLIAKLTNELKINSHYLTISVPRNATTTRNLELPSTDTFEIKDMIELQIGKQTPYASYEVIKDYHILNSDAEGYSNVLLVIVHRDIVSRYFKILEKAGLSAERVAFSSEGLLNWSRFSVDIVQRANNDRPHILVGVDYDTSDFEVVLNKKLIFGRSIALGFSQFYDQPDQEQDKFIKEVGHSIYAYLNEARDKDIDKITISGPKTFIKNLNEDVLGDKFGLSVEVIDQFKNVPITDQALKLYDEQVDKDSSFFGLIGLALTFGEQNIDLIPQELEIERNVKQKGKDLYVRSILLIAIVIIISATFFGRVYNKERYFRQLKAGLSKIQDKTERLNNMIWMLEAVKTRVSTKGMSLNLLAEVHEVIPPEINLISINFDGKERVILRGSSDAMAEIFNLVNKLEGSKYFENVETKYVTKRQVKGKESNDFEIFCPLSEKYRNINKYGL